LRVGRRWPRSHESAGGASAGRQELESKRQVWRGERSKGSQIRGLWIDREEEREAF